MHARRNLLCGSLLALLTAAAGCGGELPGDGDDGRQGEAPVALDCSRHDCEVAELAAGGFVLPGFTCARFVSGRVACWGDHGLRHPRGGLVPEGPVLVPEIDDALALSAQGQQACVRRAGGRVACWGARFAGGLEDDDGNGVVPIPGLEHVRDVAAGGSHACAVMADRTVQCWGASGLGAVGGASGELGATAAPTPIAGLEDVRQLALGFDHSCALARDGSVWCWGANDVGQLGTEVDGRCEPPLGEPADTQLPCSAEPVRVLNGALAIAAGATSTCAVDIEGGLRCWGHIGEGRGDVPYEPSPCAGDDPAPGCMPRPTPIETDGAVTQVALGKEHACALSTDATVRCWGSNRAGQLGDGTFVRRDAPGVDPGLAEVRSVTAGRLHTCALGTEGALRCWGDDEAGQLGTPGPASVTCISIVDAEYPCEPRPTSVSLER